MTEMHVLKHAHRIRRSGGHEITIVSEPRRRAVIEGDAVFAQHQPIARAADRDVRERVDVETIEEGARIGTMHFDLAQGGDIAKTDSRTYGADFAAHGLEPIFFARARKILRAQPGTAFDKHGALLLRPLV